MIRKFGTILYNTNNRTRTVAERMVNRKGKKVACIQVLKECKKKKKAGSGKSL